MKNLTLILTILALIATACTTNKPKEKVAEKSVEVQKTQAYIGLKDGGEWKWVTKNNGNEQWEYQGGEFHPVSQLKVDEKHTDHSFDIQFEGPGWESDKVGYRIYLDWRNAIDIFGKKTDSLVLHKVGLDGFDSYHEVSDWGVDVLKVGSSLGMGSVAFWDGGKAIRVEKTDSLFSEVESSAEKSKVNINYYGWEINDTKTTLQSTLEIEAGSYLTKYTLKLSEALPNLASGIVKHEGTDVQIFTDIKEDWTCLATFGVQTLQEDKLGMCVFVKTDQLLEITDDEYSDVLVMKPENNELTYYFGAAWEQDASGVTSMDEFKALLTEQAKYIR
ncbi:DUF4861 family protein [Draconibacterium halophilum]|uniref:DUF4861 domain-containing protein n=1 Tax=Draconibacterium halophilum TaxID=2706887 RepID=A0A6C0RAL2_9BACT|nr:DUF4861 family protein [Draconibacterium halophilum]QIA07658.1 DUF4861 domain-containing protein [Draconibacterium halophilum]